MKGKKGICLILCILLLTGLAPLRAAAVTGEQVDGVWSSIALTGGANKVIFTADSEIEQQILYPNEQTVQQYLLPEGVSYDSSSNTLSLTDFDAPTANLVLTMMGSDFRIRLSGSSALASISSESKGRGGSVTICGDGSLELAGGENAILVRADGSPDFVRIEAQARLTASSSGSVIRVVGTSLSDGAICADTSDPQVTAYDARSVIESVTTTEGKTLEPYTLPGSELLYGIRDDILSDEEGDRIVYNVYALGDKTEDGLYPVLEESAHNLADISAYQRACTPHDWILVRTSDGGTATQARFARFTVSTQVLGGGGTISASLSQVARGGSVELSISPWEGYKLVSLNVNGAAVEAPGGSYVIGGITADQSVTASFAEATPTRVVVTAPENTDFKVPGTGAASFLSEPFRAFVADGAGDPVGGAVRWSISPEATGVSIDQDGCVTVTPAALEIAAEPKTFTVTASFESEGLTLSNSEKTFTVSLAERKAAEIHLLRNGERLGVSDTVTIPSAEGTTQQQYAAVVYDQYGSVRGEEIIWSAGDWPAGVRRDIDTLTVWDNCRDGSTLVVTAKCASDNTVEDSVTVTFTAPPASKAAELKKAEPVRETPAPTVHWPTVTLATDADPSLCYGITWAQLVTLGDDGSASIGETPLAGSFSINREADGLPNVSDNFKIVFSYLDGEETKTIVSDERTVTLTPKKLREEMAILSATEMQYAYGEECRPVVSVRDGARALVSGTDFVVTGYAGNTGIGTGTVTVEGQGNYTDTVTKSFTITPIPASALTCSVTSCKPEDEGITPTIVFKHGDRTLSHAVDYDLSLQYDVPAKTGTATAVFKGWYSGTRVLSFDLPNYLITEGAGSSWNKGSTLTLNFKANGAYSKFMELTVDGRTVPTSYYSVSAGSTVVKIKPDYLKALTAGKHIVGVVYKDGKALAIFSIVERQGVPTGDSNNTTAWIIVLAASLVAFGALSYAFLRDSRKKKKKKNKIRE
ncbi:MAG: hypothetical protein IJQ43_05150 [Oscillospiraceae bacterium]|nr:hypothetical protein [Oscillospiraceae bacterium]